MNEERLREWEQQQQVKNKQPKAKRSRFGVLQYDPVSHSESTDKPQRRPSPKKPVPPSQGQQVRINAKRRQVQQREHQDERVQHEMREMRETHDLRDIDDDVEDVATLYEWQAVEHNHRPKSQRWYVVLAASVTVLALSQLIFGNIIGMITIAFAGGFVYWIAQREPDVVRYRIMTEGVAMGNRLYHYQDLEAFNIVYEPGIVKTVVLRSNRPLAPILHMEIGEADPVAIRDILLEFVEEDQHLHEPLVDIYARRLGF